ncbi:hypothetical protein QWZ14_29820 [Paeniroseomonas aquatica]|uniref:Uncharacterized protein n=1 Tax=Paeniroseomonas aquatica TaxID=373043 RepID=A0ABT8AFY0_9PROT|nr:hypothetical protein [Paeniroseomonas aquatica]MDN3568593.1 hypothetical protein [Paeniroseomonas aquatica]
MRLDDGKRHIAQPFARDSVPEPDEGAQLHVLRNYPASGANAVRQASNIIAGTSAYIGYRHTG